MGVVTAKEALERAQDAGLDLVLVAPSAQPPVARIIDHGKYKYEQSKLKKNAKPKGQDVKGVKLRPNTATNDIQILIRNARKFLLEGDKVRIVCQFRQRELAHPEVGQGKLRFIIEELSEIGKIDRDPQLSGREMVVVVNPKPAAAPKKADKPEAEKRDEAPAAGEEPTDSTDGQ